MGHDSLSPPSRKKGAAPTRHREAVHPPPPSGSSSKTIRGRSIMQGSSTSLYASSLNAFAITCAAIATLFGSPKIYQITKPAVSTYMANGYGYEYLDFCVFIWGILLTSVLFCAARFVIYTFLNWVSLTIAIKLGQ